MTPPSFWVAIPGEQSPRGPWERDDISRMVQEGTIPQEAQVCRQGEMEWLPLSVAFPCQQENPPSDKNSEPNPSQEEPYAPHASFTPPQLAKDEQRNPILIQSPLPMPLREVRWTNHLREISKAILKARIPILASVFLSSALILVLCLSKHDSKLGESFVIDNSEWVVMEAKDIGAVFPLPDKKIKRTDGHFLLVKVSVKNNDKQNRRFLSPTLVDVSGQIYRAWNFFPFEGDTRDDDIIPVHSQRIFFVVFDVPKKALGFRLRISDSRKGKYREVAIVPRPLVVSSGTKDQPPAKNKSIGQFLDENSDFPISLTESGWQTPLDRVVAHLTNFEPFVACPVLKDTPANNEFDVQKVKEKCNQENEKTLRYMKICPISKTVPINIKNYNFDKKSFLLSGSNGWNGMTPFNTHSSAITPGIALLPPGVLFSWSGVRPAYVTMGSELLRAGCAAALLDSLPALTTLELDLPMESSDAEELRKKIDHIHKTVQYSHDLIEIAYVLDGKVSRQDMPCNMKTSPLPTGRVLAWRLKVEAQHRTIEYLTKWISPGDFNIEFSDICSEAKIFFTPPTSSVPANTQKRPNGGKP